MASQLEENHLTVFVGCLHEKVTEDILFELFLQVGPLKRVKIPQNHETGKPQPYGFVTFCHPESVQYAIKVLKNCNLYGQYIDVKTKIVRKDASHSSECTPALISAAEQLQHRRAAKRKDSYSCVEGGSRPKIPKFSVKQKAPNAPMLLQHIPQRSYPQQYYQQYPLNSQMVVQHRNHQHLMRQQRQMLRLPMQQVHFHNVPVQHHNIYQHRVPNPQNYMAIYNQFHHLQNRR